VFDPTLRDAVATTTAHRQYPSGESDGVVLDDDVYSSAILAAGGCGNGDDADLVAAADPSDVAARYHDDYNDNYDRDRYSSDQRYDEEILDPRLHGKGTLRQSAGNRLRQRRRCRNLVLGLVFVAAAVGIIVGVVVAVSKQQQNGGGGSAVSSPIKLPPPASDLSSRCSLLEGGEGGRTGDGELVMDDSTLRCWESCEVAECCELPPTYDLSCLVGNEDRCYEYHKSCKVLQEVTPGGSTVPADNGTTNGSDNNNNNISNQGNQNGGDFGSGNASGGSASNTNGGNEENEQDSLEPAPSDLAQTCSYANLSTTKGKQACHDECLVALCCFAQDDNAVKSCSDQAACVGYAFCLNLRAHNQATAQVDGTNKDDASTGNTSNNNGNGGDSSSNTPVIKPAPTDIVGKCSSKHFKAWGKQACRQVCKHARCCWDKDNVPPCPDQRYCASYAPCLTLGSHDTAQQNHHQQQQQNSNNSNNSSSQSNSNNQNANNGNSGSSSNSQNANSSNGNNNGSSQGNGNSNNQAGNGQTTGIPVMPAPTDLSGKCSMDNIQTQAGQQECAQRCIHGTCCISNPEHCADPTLCPGYSACFNMAHISDNSSGSSNSNNHNNSNNQASNTGSGTGAGENAVEGTQADNNSGGTGGSDNGGADSSNNQANSNADANGGAGGQGQQQSPIADENGKQAADDTAPTNTADNNIGNGNVGEQGGGGTNANTSSGNSSNSNNQGGNGNSSNEDLTFEEAKNLTPDPAPANLASICSVAGIQTKAGRSKCESACVDATCCFMGSMKQCLNKDSVCAGYSSCNNLRKTTSGGGSRFLAALIRDKATAAAGLSG